MNAATCRMLVTSRGIPIKEKWGEDTQWEDFRNVKLSTLTPEFWTSGHNNASLWGLVTSRLHLIPGFHHSLVFSGEIYSRFVFAVEEANLGNTAL